MESGHSNGHEPPGASGRGGPGRGPSDRPELEVGESGGDRPDRGKPVYFAVIGDVVASRDLPNRAEVQRQLQATVRGLNQRLRDHVAVPLKLTAGDEVQGLLGQPEAVVEIMVSLADDLHPAQMVWGLGRGTLDTDPSDDIAVLDGPCLHRAREAVESAKSAGRWLVADGVEEPHGRALGSVMTLIAAIRSGWTETRMRYVREARGRQQQEVAALLGVSKQAVNQALRAAHFAAVVDAEASARDLLRWLGSRTPREETQP